MMVNVTGRATAQNTHWFTLMLRTSRVFMPRMLATVLKGRKTTVTIVKA
jgi:hypothetical protein